jgi:AcrR family transcriptional regulator
MVIVAEADKAPEGRRERILRAAVDVIRERGFAGTRVSDIAQLAGTSQGLVLYHFGSLAEALHQSITLLEDEFYAELDADLRNAVGPVGRLRHMAEMASGFGPAVGDWRLWLELWVRALHDDDARRARESLDRRWRSALTSVISEGVASGDFTTPSASRTSLRLAALMDGLAIQLALEDPGMTPRKFTDLWWESAVLELGIVESKKQRKR